MLTVIPLTVAVQMLLLQAAAAHVSHLVQDAHRRHLQRPQTSACDCTRLGLTYYWLIENIMTSASVGYILYKIILQAIRKYYTDCHNLATSSNRHRRFVVISGGFGGF